MWLQAIGTQATYQQFRLYQVTEQKDLKFVIPNRFQDSTNSIRCNGPWLAFVCTIR